MSRNLTQGLVALVMIAVIVATWGSVGSGLTLFGLIMLIGGIINQRLGEKYDEIYDEEE